MANPWSKPPFRFRFIQNTFGCLLKHFVEGYFTNIQALIDEFFE